jgi:hypothetical protein
MKLAFILEWCEAKDEWHLKDHNGAFVYELRDCANMRRLFDNPSHEKREFFVIDVHRLNSVSNATGE